MSHVSTTLTDPTHETSEPDRYWSTVNGREATPLVMTALDWTFWKKSLELAAMRAWSDLGIVAPAEVVFVDDPNQRVTGSFFGRQAVNIDRVRWLMGCLPGTTGDDVERDIFGAVRPGVVDPPRKVSKLAMARGFPGALRNQSSDAHRLRAAHYRWWRQSLDGPGGSPAKRLLGARRRFEDAQHVHIRGRSLLQGLRSQVQLLAAGVGREDLLGVLTSGMGAMEETAVVDDLWRVAHSDLTLDDFLRAHGFHGHGEGNLSGRSWREQPEQVERLLAAYAAMSPEERPRRRSVATQAARAEAESELLAAVPPLKRRLAAWMLRTTVGLTRDLEVSKAGFLLAIDAGRAAARDLGAELAKAGSVADPDDVLHLTVDEAAAHRPGDLRELVAYRRERYAHYCTVAPDDSWTGNPEPRTVAGRVDAGPGVRPDRLDGVGGSPGVVVGAARVVTDSLTDTPPGPGEVLVCAMTDPSWAPMFLLAAAVVTDIGGPASHGAIVARELGVPCVANTRTGTAVIATGDLLRVDGDAGVVEILERAPAVPATGSLS
ncbi:MAG TPA: PEP-utilizing enzyme [Acidimicrobiia bacterium]|nr:PEP-utilizing enzyme [Acidimicrobiia bacterium]